jgi:hypothetical protein
VVAALERKVENMDYVGILPNPHALESWELRNTLSKNKKSIHNIRKRWLLLWEKKLPICIMWEFYPAPCFAKL